MKAEEALHIMQIQETFRQAGYQWQEHIYNDGKYSDNLINCSIELTKDRSPHVFSEYPRPKDSVVWGRFGRLKCWQMAYDWLLLKDLGIECNLRPSPIETETFSNQFECVGGNYK